MTEHGFEVIPVDPTTLAQQLKPLSRCSLSLLLNSVFCQMLKWQTGLGLHVKAHAEIPVVLDPVLVCKESHDVEVSALRDELD